MLEWLPMQVTRHLLRCTRSPLASPSSRSNQTIIIHHKFNNKMGNVEIKDRPKKNYSIFGQRHRPSSRSPFRDVLSPNSPYYKELSPIRYSPISRGRRSNMKESLRADSSVAKSPKPQERQYYFPPREKALKRETERQEDNSGINAENKEKCEEIIRKVRNFNDFLVELKRKLKEDCTVSDKRKERSEVSLSVKLQNERVELQKYKKLVERELSKTHSIQNISIQNATNGEKILTIQYEDISTLEHKEQPQKYHYTERQHIEEAHHHQFPEAKREKENEASQPADCKEQQPLSQRLMEISKNNDSVQSRDPTSLTYDKRLKQAKTLWDILKKKTHQLGLMLAQEEKLEQDGEGLRDYLAIKERLVKLNDLYASIESANRHSVEIERKIRGLLA